MGEKEIIDNLRKCTSWDRCSMALCPLDLELSSRVGRMSERCRYMKEPKVATFKGLSFISGGTVMPDDSLKYVPKDNLPTLNTASQKRWDELTSKINFKAL